MAEQTISLALLPNGPKPTLLYQTLINNENKIQNIRYNIIDNQEVLYDMINRLNKINLKLNSIKSKSNPRYSTTGELTFY